ncbi:MAG TPA: CAP domain-containing protein [Gemmatimonadaceae bacterium]
MTPLRSIRTWLARAAGAALLVACSSATTAQVPGPRAEPARAPASGAPRTAPPAAPRDDGESAPLIAGLSRLETDILVEMNRARRDPRGYADLLERRLRHYEGNILRLPGQTPIRTEEGPAAVREAIRVLRGLQPVAPLGHAPGLSRAARDHVRDQGRRGTTGHRGSDGSSASDRVSRHGAWDVSVAENIAYGPATGREVVIGLIVDDGVPNRGHRTTIFDPTLRVAGAACGEHRGYGTMCVVNYAGVFAEGQRAGK